MSDVTSALIKILSSLVSPKSSFKVVFIAASLVVCWVYIHPLLVQIGLPPEISLPVILFAGLGTGTLLCDFCTHILFYFISLVNKNIEKRKASMKRIMERLEKEESDQQFIEKFKQTYVHFDTSMKEPLRKLTHGDSAFNDTSIIRALYANKLISIVANIDTSKKLYSINPLIANHVETQWKEEIERGIEDFLIDLTPLKKRCLELLEVNDSSFDGKIKKIRKSIFTSKYSLLPVLDCNISNSDESFFFYFREGYREAMEKRLSKSLLDEVEVILA